MNSALPSSARLVEEFNDRQIWQATLSEGKPDERIVFFGIDLHGGRPEEPPTFATLVEGQRWLKDLQQR